MQFKSLHNTPSLKKHKAAFDMVFVEVIFEAIARYSQHVYPICSWVGSISNIIVTKIYSLLNDTELLFVCFSRWKRWLRRTTGRLFALEPKSSSTTRMLIKCLLCSVRKRVRISLCSEHGTIEGKGLNVRDGEGGQG